MMSIVYKDVVTFFNSEYLKEELKTANPVTFANTGNISPIIVPSADWHNTIFGIKSVQEYTIKAFLFSSLYPKYYPLVAKQYKRGILHTLQRY